MLSEQMKSLKFINCFAAQCTSYKKCSTVNNVKQNQYCQPAALALCLQQGRGWQLSVDSAKEVFIIFNHPGYLKSIHIAVYLPTQGQESEFMDSIAKLNLCIDQLHEEHSEAALYLRGDFNVNENNKARQHLLNHFCQEHCIAEVILGHRTYHHFMGSGQSTRYDQGPDNNIFR